TMSNSEVITIMIMFHQSRYRDIKSFYINYIQRHCASDFPHTVSYNRFVELQQKALIPMVVFLQLCCLGKCTGISIIETINDLLKNGCQIEHTRHRCFNNFIANLVSGLIAYNLAPKKPALNLGNY
ncbi:MAG: hypothetical protein FWE30_08480, partial [Bacteroidales bacterium]|nr:hypothetical protein [Bacteroidales bacterium]